MGDAEIQEASATAQTVVGFSAYLHGITYDVEQFKRELDAAVAHVRSQMQQQG
jgi:hypothetical protein